MAQRRTHSMALVTDFEFIMGTIFAQKDDSPLSKAFEREGIIDAGGIMTLCIARLKYPGDTSDPPVTDKLRLGYQLLVRGFQAFVQSRDAAGCPIHEDWQNKDTKIEFDAYTRLIGWAQYVGVAYNALHNASHNASYNALADDHDIDSFDLDEENGINPVPIPSETPRLGSPLSSSAEDLLEDDHGINPVSILSEPSRLGSRLSSLV